MSETLLDRVIDARDRYRNDLGQIVNRAETEQRPLTAAERAETDLIGEQIDECETRIDELRRSAAMELDLQRAMSSFAPSGGQPPTPVGHDGGSIEDLETWLPSRRAYDNMRTRAVGSSGNPLLPTEHYGLWADRLRARSVVLAAGPVVIPTENTKLLVPQLSASATVGTLAENTAITPSDPTLDGLELEPQKFAALVLAANEALDDSKPSAALRGLIAMDLVRTTATAIDQAFLAGSGSGSNPLGLRRQTGVTAGPNLGTNGGTPTLDTFADMLEAFEMANGNLDAAAWFMSPRTWGTVRTFKDDQSRYQVSPDPTLDGRRGLFGRPVFTSTNVAVNETKGTSNDCSYLMLVDMSQVVVAQRKDVEVQMSTDYAFGSDQTAIRVIARFDIGVLNPEALVLTTGVRT